MLMSTPTGVFSVYEPAVLTAALVPTAFLIACIGTALLRIELRRANGGDREDRDENRILHDCD